MMDTSWYQFTYLRSFKTFKAHMSFTDISAISSNLQPNVSMDEYNSTESFRVNSLDDTQIDTLVYSLSVVALEAAPEDTS